jgi:uncharacterized protein YjcR
MFIMLEEAEQEEILEDEAQRQVQEEQVEVEMVLLEEQRLQVLDHLILAEAEAEEDFLDLLQVVELVDQV